MSGDLVLYGGDKSGLAVCTMTGADWKWAAPAITGKMADALRNMSLLCGQPVMLEH